MNKNCLQQQQQNLQIAVGPLTVPSPKRPRFKIEIPEQVGNDMSDRLMESFSAFIRRTQFSPEFASVDTALIPLIRTSSTLRHIAIAIGALDASRRSVVRTIDGSKTHDLIAFKSYHQAILSLQSSINEEDAAKREDVLWATFLLGLFEVCAFMSLPPRLLFELG
jgi:hypothetical protein